MMGSRITGAASLAQGAIESDVSLVAGYPGAPATAVFNAIRDQTNTDQVQLEWTSNEKSAIEIAYGASVAGLRSLLCVKSVGLNIALDPLMSLVLAGCNAGLVILAGDDPGGWGSQNEQDSRSLALAAEIPILEPTTVADARSAMREAFSLSEKLSLPVMVRITRALTYATAELEGREQSTNFISDRILFEREYMRWVVLPVNVVPYHDRHLKKLLKLGEIFDQSEMNETVGEGDTGVICAGFLYQKLFDTVGGEVPAQLKILR
jgi:indolepyruvate ferredoxin oxidoreductase alpha subunit